MTDTVESLRAELDLANVELDSSRHADVEHLRAELAAEKERRERAETQLATSNLLRIKAERDAACDRLLAIEREAWALVEALPKCDECSTPATRAFERGGKRYCDLHGVLPPEQRLHAPWVSEAPEYPRAAPLRALVAALGDGAKLPPVPRGHCTRCDRCGWPLVAQGEAGCWATNCSMRPMPEKRTTCAGCGAPYEVKP